MTKFDEIIESLSAVIQNPEKVVQDYKEKNRQRRYRMFPYIHTGAVGTCCRLSSCRCVGKSSGI